MALLVAWSLSASSGWCMAQELDNSPDAALTGEQRQQRVQEARRRSEEFVANARTQRADPPTTDKEDAEGADQRAMNDPSFSAATSLQPAGASVSSLGVTAKSVSPAIFCQRPHRAKFTVRPLAAAR